MGTGTTSTDKCRVGSNNFGRLLHTWIIGTDPSITYFEKVCSGDTLTGVAQQIAAWDTASAASIATLSVGGNDVFFSDLVWNCVITPNTARLGSTNRANCVATEEKAMEYMNDNTDSGLQYKLKEAYISILEKSGQSVRPHQFYVIRTCLNRITLADTAQSFHLYVTSYVAFFNADTTDCDKTTFHYFWAAYDPSSDPILNRIVYLTTDLRAELNNLVITLNSVIQAAVNDANTEYGTSQVHFVDVNAYYDIGQHRWCENPNAEFHEPDPDRVDTYFFFSAWKDTSISGALDVGFPPLLLFSFSPHWSNISLPLLIHLPLISRKRLK